MFPGKNIHKDLTPLEVTIEANRCLYCYDAPCTKACPTHIDVPGFISQIADGNLKGSARTILDANPLGASCARVCPVEQLCEGACVYNTESDTPIRIGDLQRYATDVARERGTHVFSPGAPTGKRVAIVGGGPAGLAAARDLRRYGHGVTIFEARAELGGLNTYGIVPFRLPADVALWEAQEIVDLGCEVRTGVRVGDDIDPASLVAEYDAVVFACGMGNVPKLGIEGDEYIWDALDFIERAKTDGAVEGLGSTVAVIGAGNTAIDALTCAKRLGAQRVTMYYRRGEENMPAYEFEYDFAKEEGIEFRFFCKPARVVAERGRVVALELERTRGEGRFVEPCDTVISAIGQRRLLEAIEALGIAHDDGVVRVDDAMRTSREGVFAAGDCLFAKGEREAMVVEAAEQGKTAARSINAYLNGAKAPAVHTHG
ncbi:MAG: NAD(P)-dependent oxidoreductase [Candidatus Tyrphobacter sp.]